MGWLLWPLISGYKTLYCCGNDHLEVNIFRQYYIWNVYLSFVKPPGLKLLLDILSYRVLKACITLKLSYCCIFSTGLRYEHTQTKYSKVFAFTVIFVKILEGPKINFLLLNAKRSANQFTPHLHTNCLYRSWKGFQNTTGDINHNIKTVL